MSILTSEYRGCVWNPMAQDYTTRRQVSFVDQIACIFQTGSTPDYTGTLRGKGVTVYIEFMTRTGEVKKLLVVDAHQMKTWEEAIEKAIAKIAARTDVRSREYVSQRMNSEDAIKPELEIALSK